MSDPSPPTRSEILQALFNEASELPPHDRGAFLDARCAGDEAMRADVESLLAADEHAGPFLAEPTIEPHRVGRDSPHAGPHDHPRQIGPYKLLHAIGEGGFGTVYLAEQEHPVRRHVALKLIKLGMDTRQVIARFEAERQALAMMDHSHIAKVFDAGATEDGRPFFVMELVRGTPITQYCDEHSLSITSRMELFAQVCHAVQHAHQKGLIHRDIKPTNVLVETLDGRPSPKVIDFGVAKATAAQLTEKTLFTEFRQFVGTPEYMSPEQAAGSRDVDTRSDVYSLGVLLYELLTGSTPFSARELRSKAYVEIERIIREDEPPKPSTRLSRNNETLAGVAALRQTQPRKLGASVRGELDWIAMKCLEKDRSRRYETANGLAMDVQRFLGGEAVLAAPPSGAYRLKKFVKRHRGPVIASAAVVIVLIAGIIGTTTAMIGESRQRAVAEQQRAEAEAQQRESERLASLATAVSQFQGEMFRSARPGAAGDKVTVVEAMETAVKRLQAGALKDQPVAEANVLEMIGQTFRSLGRDVEAEPLLRRAVELRRAALPGPHWGVARALQTLAQTAQELGKLDQAEAHMREALAIARQVGPAGDLDIAAMMADLGHILEVQAKYPEAEALCREALEVHRRRRPVDDLSIAYSLSRLGWVLQVEGKFPEAESVCREALALRRRALPRAHPDVAESLNHLAVVLARSDRLPEAEPLFREMLEIDRQSLPAGHPRIGQDLNNLASALQEQGKLAEAEPLQREGLALRRKSLPAGHPYIAQSLKNLAVLLQQQGKLAEAEPLAREALAIRRAALPAGHPDVAGSLQNLGSLLHDQDKFAEGEAALLEAEAILVAAQGLPATRRDECVEAIVDLYADWNQAEPDKGYDAKSEQWRAKRPTTRPATAPSH